MPGWEGGRFGASQSPVRGVWEVSAATPETSQGSLLPEARGGAGTRYQRLFAAGTTVYGTGKSGTVVLTTDGWTYSFNTTQALTAADAGA